MSHRLNSHKIHKKPAPGATPGDGNWARDKWYGTVYFCSQCREEGPWTLFTIASCPVPPDCRNPVITGIPAGDGRGEE